ncbi:uncharacterized protein LOC119583397 [Penaeus monodon]|uniref:uncharacterized protein LOC119583397 n=1 Tax=Penaeus monodon TaxID=6687 RepID=UPI0018A752A3|nr:uncharacterized protein LOC119583397 [Penaeus monodon]
MQYIETDSTLSPDARAKFAKLRSDVLVKLELLDSKHVQHLTEQLTRTHIWPCTYHSQCQELMHDKHWFPIEMDMVGTKLSSQIIAVTAYRVKRMMKNCWILKVQQKQQRQSLSNHWQKITLNDSKPQQEAKTGNFEDINLLETFKRERAVNFFYIIWNDVYVQRITYYGLQITYSILLHKSSVVWRI